MYNIINDFSLRGHNTFGLDAVAEKFAEYTDEKDLPSLWGEIEESHLPVFHIGEGSNILFTGRFEGVVVSSKILDLEMIPTGGGNVSLTAGAGIKLDNLIERCCDAGLWGLENLSLIPGTVGASVVQNVGAYGRDASDSVLSVRAFDTQTKCFVTLRPEDCQFGYRTSMFKQPANKGRYVVVNVTYRLSSLPEPHLEYGNLGALLKDISELTPCDVRNAVIDVRRAKLPDPAEVGSAGSYFTNPVVSLNQFEDVLKRTHTLWGADVNIPHWETDNGIKISAAWMLDRLGWKGRKIGGAMVWPSQPLVIVNADGNATAADIISLEKAIISDVESHLGVMLRPEVEKVPHIQVEA